MNLYFLRHGESEANVTKTYAGQTDSPLTAKGLLQARIEAQRLRNDKYTFDIIISSPLVRALDTAKEVAGALGYATEGIVIDKLAMERCGGQCEGVSQSEFFALSEQEQNILGAESFKMLGIRAQEFMDKMVSLYPENAILVVSHATFGEVLKSIIDFGDYAQWPKIGTLPNTKTIKLV